MTYTTDIYTKNTCDNPGPFNLHSWKEFNMNANESTPVTGNVPFAATTMEDNGTDYDHIRLSAREVRQDGSNISGQIIIMTFGQTHYVPFVAAPLSLVAQWTECSAYFTLDENIPVTVHFLGEFLTTLMDRHFPELLRKAQAATRLEGLTEDIEPVEKLD